MININFDNAYWLLIAIPLAAVLLVPFFIAIHKEARNAKVVATLVLHLVITVLVSFACAGTTLTTVITETNVYVLADVSYSADKNLDKVDAYVREVEDSLPRNSEMGVICFGRDYQLHTELGDRFTTVQTAEVDQSATDIVSAVEYAASLFKDGVIKRIVLITDGKDTVAKDNSALISAVENLYAQGIYIDAMYLDDNLSQTAKEVQLTSVFFNQSTYLNHETTADVMIQSSYAVRAMVYLNKNGQTYKTETIDLTQGYNVLSFDLDTKTAAANDYELIVEPLGEDENKENDRYTFTQTVTGEVNVLLISSKTADKKAVEDLYGSRANIDSYIGTSEVPFTIEELCKYDEIMLSNIDVRTLDNYTAFVDAVDKAVSQFGKSLVTFGDTYIQNQTDDVLKQLEDMLPVRFGNNDQDPKFLGIVIDTSRSMENFSRFQMAKEAAIQMLELMNEQDEVAVVAFSGSAVTKVKPTSVSKKDEIIDTINGLEPTQGTYLGLGMQTMFDLVKNLDTYSEKQIMLISDGLSHTVETDTPSIVARNMRANEMYISVLNTGSSDGAALLENIANLGGGNYYFVKSVEELKKLMLADIANDLTESIIEQTSAVKIQKKYDGVLNGVSALPDIGGYVYGKAKSNATTVLTTEYVKLNGGVVTVPVYAYWTYGSGKVSCFTSDIANGWTSAWQTEDSDGERFYQNVFTESVPVERVGEPYTLTVESDGTSTSIDIQPATFNLDAKIALKITTPKGDVVERELSLDSTRYYYEFLTSQTGKYTIEITYTYGLKEYYTTAYAHVSYAPEYNSFTAYDSSDLHNAIRHRGTVSEDGTIDLENNEDEIASYTIGLTAPFLIAAIALFVVDIVVRKLKWEDIKGLFTSQEKGAKK